MSLESMDNSNPITESELGGIKKIRIKRHVVFLLFLCGLPLLALLQAVVSDSVMQIYAISYVLFFILVNISYGSSTCPRCHKKFFYSTYANPFANKCLHCGLRLKLKKGNGA